jgi:beta-glucosidase
LLAQCRASKLPRNTHDTAVRFIHLDVAFPFGLGLSYTSFAYGDAAASVDANGDIDVRLTVTNTGSRDGREVVQVCTSLAGSTVQRPVRELKAFASVALAAGETREVVLVVRRDDLAFWRVAAQRWVVEGGSYLIDVAASSRDLRSSASVEVEGDVVSLPLTRESSMGEVFAHPIAGPIVQQAMAAMTAMAEGAVFIMPEDVDMMKMMDSFPLGRIGMIAGKDLSPEMIDQLIAMANAPQQS